MKQSRRTQNYRATVCNALLNTVLRSDAIYYASAAAVCAEAHTTGKSLRLA